MHFGGSFTRQQRFGCLKTQTFENRFQSASLAIFLFSTAQMR